MEWWQAIFLGVLQGLTEFLPVSSSAHLLLSQEIMGIDQTRRIDAFDVVTHVGTLAAVFSYFSSDWKKVLSGAAQSIKKRSLATQEERLPWLLVLGTVPVVLVGLLLFDFIDAIHEKPGVIAGTLIAFSFVFLLAERFRGEKQLDDARLFHALFVGCAQCLALVFPGVSRSGATISAAMFAGFERAAAARFSFLLSTPAIILAFLHETPVLVSVLRAEPSFFVPVILGFITSAVSGWLAISVLLKFLGHHSLGWFAAYRIPVGVGLLIYFLVFH